MLTYVARSIYIPKKMTNSNILSGRGMILSGDRQKAGTYVGIARRKMYDMKQMMSISNIPYMKRVHHLDRDCVWVHLTSIDGADFIKIHACAEGGVCKFETPDAPGTIISEWKLSCPEAGQSATWINLSVEDYYPWDDTTYQGGAWWFGDPATNSRQTNFTAARIYDYGTFYPSLTTWVFYLPVVETVMTGKSASGATPADALNNWNAEPWVTPYGGHLGPSWYLRYDTSGSGTPYTYTGVKQTSTYDLTSASFTLMPDATAYVYFRVVGYDIPSGAVSATGGESISAESSPVIGAVKNIAGSIGGEPSVTILDSGGYSALPTPTVIGTSSGYFSHYVAQRQNIYRTSKTIKLKADGTIRQVGTSTHEKVDDWKDYFTG